MPEPLPRFNRQLQELEDKRKLEKLLLESAEVENESGVPVRRSADGHNRDRRRGLPLITRGVGGASPGSDPVAALLAKEARGKRQR